MRRSWVAGLIAALAVPAAGRAQVAACPGGSVTVSVQVPKEYPDGRPRTETAFSDPRAGTLRDGGFSEAFPLGADLLEEGWVVGREVFEGLRELGGRNGEGQLAILWKGRDPGDEGCVQALVLGEGSPLGDGEDGNREPGTTGEPSDGETRDGGQEPDGARDTLRGPGAVLPDAYGEGECYAAGSDWLGRIAGREEYDAGDVTVIVFREADTVCYINRDYGVVGDPIFVGIFTQNPQDYNGVSVSYEPCALEPEAPKIFVSGDLADVLGELQAGEWRLRTNPPRSCFNRTVNVALAGRRTGAEAGEVSARHVLRQFQRYRGTVQLGVVFTDQHDPEFGLRPAADGGRVIFDRGPRDTGPEYFASMVVYSVLRYLPPLFSGEESFPGRDIVHDNSLVDRLGGVLGVGLGDPAERFVAGFAFEAVQGINVLGLWDVARVERLEGVAEGDAFAGTAEEIPTSRVWETDFSWGLSVDLRYVVNLFAGG